MELISSVVFYFLFFDFSNLLYLFDFLKFIYILFQINLRNKISISIYYKLAKLLLPSPSDSYFSFAKKIAKISPIIW